MKRTFKILGISIGGLLLSVFVFEKYFLTQWYDFEMGNVKIEVMSDECETCFLDWTIDHTIWIESKCGANGKFELYTEDPVLEFGLNADSSELVVNCPGFSNLFIDVNRMQVIDVPFEQRDIKLKYYNIRWIVTKKQELIKLNTPRLPYENWGKL